jgi:hypothetical protein
MEVSIKLNVLFQETFWVGVFEKDYGEKYEVSKVVFGAEPKDYQVYDFILKNFYNLSFSNPVCIETAEKTRINPKRYQREIKKEMENKGIGTKAQIAMKLQQEKNKTERKIVSKEEKEEEKQKKFELRQQKKKDKQRGR